jgi:hypothetical protein
VFFTRLAKMYSNIDQAWRQAESLTVDYFCICWCLIEVGAKVSDHRTFNEKAPYDIEIACRV